MKRKVLVAVAVFVILCVCVFSGKKTSPNETADLHIWYPGGYEILMKKELNDVEAIREMEKRLDISVDFSGVTGKLDSAFQTLMLDLKGTDAVFYRFSADQLRSSWENGQILDYSPWIDQMPNLKKLFEKNPLLYQYASVDGKCLFFPSILENNVQEVLLGIRQDWREQAGVESVDSLSDLTQMLLIQKEQFEQEGKQQGKDYVGLSSWNGYIEQFQRVFGTDQGIYWNEEHSDLIYGPSTDDYRSYLIWLKQLYQQGLLDQNLYETETTSFDKYFLNSMSSAVLTTGRHAERLEKYSVTNGDNIALEFVNVDSLQEGVPAIYRADQRKNQVLEYGFVINAEIDEEHLQMLLKMIDFLYSDEGMELMNWGLENEHWTIADGRRVYLPELAGTQEMFEAAMAPYVKPDMLRTDRTVCLSMISDELREAVSACDYEEDYSFDRPRGYYTAEEQEKSDQLELNLTSFVEETSMNFIFRTIDPADDEDWQDYLDTLHQFGEEEYLEIQKAAWGRMQQRVYTD